VLGGIHVTLCPDEAAEHADSIFLGDAEPLWHEVLKDAEKGSLKTLYQSVPGVGQIGGVVPRRAIYNGKGYLPISLMQFTRGCHFSCNFCAVSSYFNSQHFTRDPEEVVSEIREQSRKLIFFVDDNIASDKEALKALCLALLPLKISWVSQASLDIVHDNELIKLMAESGCIGNVVGFESINLNSLHDGKKQPNMACSPGYAYEIKKLRECGMQTWAAFTLGYDHDTRESILETVDFAIKNRFAFAAFNVLLPYPNTAFYETLKEENRLLYGGRWWLSSDYRFNHAAFIPKNMSPEELTDLCFYMRRKFNSFTSIVYRFSDLHTHLRSFWRARTFLKYNLLCRKEVHKKQNMTFGIK
jgi:radical SAM superfamily enzyme YgiQ (UPF0313 family)